MDIRQARKSLDLTQAELADRLGIHHTAISRYETGAAIPDKRTMIALEAIFSGHAPALPDRSPADVQESAAGQ